MIAGLSFHRSMVIQTNRILFKHWLWGIAASFLAVVPLSAQRVLFGKLEAYLDDYVATLPVAGSNVYRDPQFEDQENIAKAVKLLLAGDLEEANSVCGQSSYEVIRYIDNSGAANREFWGLQPQPGSANHWGVLFWNPVSCRNLVLQCPHPKFDSNTGLQGAYLFLHMEVSGLMISGTHRCNSIAPTECSGTTSACGSSAPYRLSDIAHNAASIFQTVTINLAESGVQTFIQLHGFAKAAGDPNLIISNGTRDVPAVDPVADLRNALYDLDPSLTFKIVHIHTDWTKLTAFTNTQGRYLNESPAPCTQNASIASGRFIHIEQEYDRFRRDEAGWELLQHGLEAAFSCELVGNNTVPSASRIPKITRNGDAITISSAEEKVLSVYLNTVDGRTLFSGRQENERTYRIPRGRMTFLTIRDGKSGQLLVQKKFFLP